MNVFGLLAQHLLRPLPQNIQKQMGKIDYTNYAPMGRVTSAARYLAPKVIQRGAIEFEKDAANYARQQAQEIAQSRMLRRQQAQARVSMQQRMPQSNNQNLIQTYLSKLHK